MSDDDFRSILYAKTLLQAGIRSSVEGHPQEALQFFQDACECFERQNDAADVVVTQAWIKAAQSGLEEQRSAESSL